MYYEACREHSTSVLCRELEQMWLRCEGWYHDPAGGAEEEEGGEEARQKRFYYFCRSTGHSQWKLPFRLKTFQSPDVTLDSFVHVMLLNGVLNKRYDTIISLSLSVAVIVSMSGCSNWCPPCMNCFLSSFFHLSNLCVGFFLSTLSFICRICFIIQPTACVLPPSAWRPLAQHRDLLQGAGGHSRPSPKKQSVNQKEASSDK